MTRVTYGNGAASYLSISSVTECDNQAKVLNDVQEADRDFNVDNILTEAPSVEEAIKLQRDLIRARNSCEFNLQKWTCFGSSIMLSLPPE